MVTKMAPKWANFVTIFGQFWIMIFMTIMCFFRQNFSINVTRISQYRHENHDPKLTKKHEKCQFYYHDHDFMIMIMIL